MPLYDARCSACAVVVEDILLRQGEVIPPCPSCGEHLIRLPPTVVVRMGSGEGRSSKTMRWADMAPSDLDTAERASRTYYEMCRSHGIGKDRAREISAEAGPQTQVTVEAGRKAIEAKKAGSA